MIAENIGCLLASVIEEKLDGDTSIKQTVKIRDFDESEVSFCISELERLLADQLTSTTIRVAGAGEDSPIDSRFRLKTDETLTGARLSEEKIAILFELAPQSDSSSSRHVVSIDDSKVLERCSDNEREKNLTRLLQITMQNAGVPDELNILPAQEGVIAMSHVLASTATGSRALRVWAEYVGALAKTFSSMPSPDQQRQALGEKLPSLLMFRDPSLYNEEGHLDQYRVRLNSRVSQVRSSQGQLLSTDKELKKIDEFEPSADVLERLDLSATDVKSKMSDFILNRTEDLYTELELSLWVDYQKKPPPDGGPQPLGDLAREDIESNDASRLQEFDDLEVHEGLNQNSRSAAEKFVNAESESESGQELIDLLTQRTRRRVERLVESSAKKISDPLLEILRMVHEVGVANPITLELKSGDMRAGGLMSLWLFAFTWGKSLRQIVDSTSEGPLSLECDLGLVQPDDKSLQEWIRGEKSDDEWWAPLQLEVLVGGETQNFTWDPEERPELAALAARIIAQGSFLRFDELDSGTLEASYFSARAWSRSDDDDVSGMLHVEQLIAIRKEHMTQWMDGLESNQLVDFVSTWQSELDHVKKSLVPSGARLPELAVIASMDTCELANGKVALLPTDPIYLRWLAAHLQEMTSRISDAMIRGLRLNPINDQFYFLQLEKIGPAGAPPFLINNAGDYCLADSSEEPLPLYSKRARSNEGSSFRLGPDRAASREMFEQVDAYLRSYPNKMHGLTVALFLHEGSSALIHDLVRFLDSKTKREIRLQVYVFCPRATHVTLRREIDDFLQESIDTQRRFLPRVQVTLRNWNHDMPLEDPDLEGSIDVAMAPGIFSNTSLRLDPISQSADTSISFPYHPWMDPCITDEDSQSAPNVSKRLLPFGGDPLLETWSTVQIRSTSPRLQVDAPSNVDYLSLTVEFDRQQGFFLQLHKFAHWVVTVDRFIGREQIDAIENGPDVIVVKPQIGVNEAFTLMVSSESGREFVVKRLARKLQPVLSDNVEAAPEALAQSVYRSASSVAPGSLLRALGLGNTAEEILGLVVSRFIIECFAPVADDRETFSVWLSLDDLQDWFGGASAPRADLARFAFSKDPTSGDVSLQVLVLESKFRKNYDGEDRARRQLDTSVELFREALGREEDARDDSSFWLRELANAIEKTPKADTGDEWLPTARLSGEADESMRKTALDSLRADNFELTSVTGAFVGTGYADASGHHAVTRLGDHQAIRVDAELYEQVLLAVNAKESPDLFSSENLSHHFSWPPDAPEPRPSQSPAPPVAASEDSEGVTTQNVSATAEEADVDQADEVSIRAEDHQGVGEDQLRIKYVNLLAAIEEKGVRVEEVENDPYSEGPSYFVFRVKAKRGTSASSVTKTADDVGMRMELPQGASIRIYTDRGDVCFEIPKTEDERYWVTAESLWEQVPTSAEDLIAPLGQDLSGDPVSINFSSNNSPHLLVAGTTGGGKSVALETLLHGLARYPHDRVKFGLIDPKGVELIAFEDDPRLARPIGVSAEEAIDLLEFAVNEMNNRYERFRPVRARSLRQFNDAVEETQKMPWYVIVLDEYQDLTSDRADKTRIESLFSQLAIKARAVGIHLVAATQRPDSTVVSGSIRSNFPAQLALRTRDRSNSVIILTESGAESLAGDGDALFRTQSGTTTRLQVGVLREHLARWGKLSPQAPKNAEG